MKNQRTPITTAWNKTLTGGIHKEVYMLKMPCIRLNENTGWVETLEEADKKRISKAIKNSSFKNTQDNLFIKEKSCGKIIKMLLQNQKKGYSFD